MQPFMDYVFAFVLWEKLGNGRDPAAVYICVGFVCVKISEFYV